MEGATRVDTDAAPIVNGFVSVTGECDVPTFVFATSFPPSYR